MNYLLDKTSIRAWLVTTLQADAAGEIAIADLIQNYTNAVGVRFTAPERQQIAEHVVAQSLDFLGVRVRGENNNAAAIAGVSFRPSETIMGKPVLFAESNTVINFDSGFNDKGGLSSVGAANKGVACAFNCDYCSTGTVMVRNPQTRILRVLRLKHEDVVIRRLNPFETAMRQLTNPDGSRRFDDPADNRIIEIASLVDPLPTLELMEETEQLVRLIFELTPFRVRILTKSGLLAKFARRFTGPDKDRLLLGLSIGIPWDAVAKDVEKGTTMPSTRFRIHQELLDEGFKMFGMACPVLAVPDYRKLADEIAAKIQADKLEKVWVEVINQRGPSLKRTTAALQAGGHYDLAKHLGRVSSSKIRWEVEYNRAAFLAFKEVIPPGKLAFLTYVDGNSEQWWSQHAKDGAVLLG